MSAINHEWKFTWSPPMFTPKRWGFERVTHGLRAKVRSLEAQVAKLEALNIDKLQLVFEGVCFIREEAARERLGEAYQEVGRLAQQLRTRPAPTLDRGSEAVKSVTAENARLRKENTGLRAELGREKRKTHFACPECGTRARRQGASLESLDTSQAGGIPDGITFVNDEGRTVTTAGYMFLSAKNEGFSRACHRVESH